ncbi:protein lin-32-like [Rhopilema esculentum]|uniref:protein lin-32-like n=1 Tax=Rhopilema esculentum TaxID=499914 RepID=UPI0031E33036|eukprot:gene13428-4297_t
MEKDCIKERILCDETFMYDSDNNSSITPPSPNSDTQSIDSENPTADLSPRRQNDYDFTRRVADAATLKVKRLRANDRERRRVNLINSAMEMLRKVIPELRERRKITKLELLRCANRYIWTLQQSLLTGRSMVEIQETFSYYQRTGSFPGAAFYDYDCGVVCSYQTAAPE